MFIIVCTSGNKKGMYVRGGGYESAYTNKVEFAKRFVTKEQAQKECCGNEIPMRYPK